MRDRGESFARRRAHALRRRIGRGERWVAAFEIGEAAEELVEIGVRDLGRVLLVVEPVVPLDLAPQLLGAGRHVARDVHGRRGRAR
jgi:hypothetical protein